MRELICPFKIEFLESIKTKGGKFYWILCVLVILAWSINKAVFWKSVGVGLLAFLFIPYHTTTSLMDGVFWSSLISFVQMMQWEQFVGYLLGIVIIYQLDKIDDWS